MNSYRIFSFENARIGDKVAGAYLLQAHKRLHGHQYIIIDPTYDETTNFPIKQFFPDISEFVIETKKASEMYNLLAEKGFEGMHFGNLWITAPSMKHDTGMTPRIVIPQYIKMFQEKITVLDDEKKNVPISKYPIRIINHCLTTAGYNVGRNHNPDQWRRFMNRIRDYITDNKINAVVVDVPENGWSVQQIIALLNLGNFYIGGDTGFSHIFAGLHNDEPLIAIYGDSSHDERAFEDERVRMGCSHQWCSEPLSNNVHRFNMENNLFNEEEVFEKFWEILNQKLAKDF